MSSNESAPTPIRNRLAIAHLMLWTLGSAIILAFYRALVLNQDEAAAIPGYWRIYALAYSLIAGAQVGSLLLWGWRRWHGTAGFPTQPGHWLLLVEGLSTVLAWSGRGLAAVMTEKWHRDLFTLGITQLPNCVITTVAYLFARRQLPRESGLWRASLLLLALEHFVAAVFYGMLMLDEFGSFGFLSLYSFQISCFSVLTCGALLAASLHDPQRGGRDFLHWTGIVGVFAVNVLHLASRWLAMLFR